MTQCVNLKIIVVTKPDKTFRASKMVFKSAILFLKLKKFVIFQQVFINFYDKSSDPVRDLKILNIHSKFLRFELHGS